MRHKYLLKLTCKASAGGFKRVSERGSQSEILNRENARGLASLKMPLGSIHSFSKHLLSARYAPGVKDTKGRWGSIEKFIARQPHWLSLDAGYVSMGKVPNLLCPSSLTRFLEKPHELIHVNALSSVYCVIRLYRTVCYGLCP